MPFQRNRFEGIFNTGFFSQFFCFLFFSRVTTQSNNLPCFFSLQASISQRDIWDIQHKINNMPRKVIGYKTAKEVYLEHQKEAQNA
jgi:hypothetical protein